VRGHGSNPDQKGAVTDLAGRPYGAVLVVALAIGVAAYALWQLVQVFTGPAGEQDSTAKRLRCLASAVAYAALCFSCVSVLAGARRSQSSQQAGFTAKVMRHHDGRWAVGLAGAVIVVIGVVLVVQGLRASFMQRMRSMPPRTETFVRRLGQVGSAGRGAVFALAGVLVVDAARTFDPQKAKGLDGAIRTLLDQPYGRWLAGLAALGLLAFGLFGLTEARYREV
jgi:hypothetical protein